MKSAPPIVLTQEEQATLTRWSHGRSTPVRLVRRAQIVLRAAQGELNKDIAAALEVTPNMVGLWRQRFADLRLKGIAKDAPRGGRIPRKRAALARRILETTTQAKPPDGSTHWSTRTLAAYLGCDHNMVHRVWRANGLQPHRVYAFKVSNDPHFVDKVVDIVGLYLNPPEHALVLSVDEKTQIQALDRTQPSLPLKPGRCGTMTHDYKRNGTTTLFAALEMAEGRVIATCMKQHRHQEWIKFLKLVDEQTPADLELHLIVDNYATHKHPRVQSWLKRHKRFHLHFTPTSSSWLNMIERWFRDLTDKRVRRGTFKNVPQLIQAIQDYTDHHNKNPKALVWTAKAEEILKKVQRAKAVLQNLQSE
jgi:transposase